MRKAGFFWLAANVACVIGVQDTLTFALNLPVALLIAYILGRTSNV